MSNVVMLPQRARANECWDFSKAQAFLASLEGLLETQGKRPRFTAKLATGRQIRLQFDEAGPDDFWIVFRKAGGFLSNQSVAIHQSAFRDFLDVVRTDKSTRPAIVYTVDDISELVDRVRMAAIYESSGPIMKNSENKVETHARNASLNEQLHANWLVLTIIFMVAAFFYSRTDRLEDKIDNKIASKEYVDGEFKALRASIDGSFEKLNQRLDIMSPGTPVQAPVAPTSPDNR